MAKARSNSRIFIMLSIQQSLAYLCSWINTLLKSDFSPCRKSATLSRMLYEVDMNLQNQSYKKNLYYFTLIMYPHWTVLIYNLGHFVLILTLFWENYTHLFHIIMYENSISITFASSVIK